MPTLSIKSSCQGLEFFDFHFLLCGILSRAEATEEPRSLSNEDKDIFAWKLHSRKWKFLLGRCVLVVVNNSKWFLSVPVRKARCSASDGSCAYYMLYLSNIDETNAFPEYSISWENDNKRIGSKFSNTNLRLQNNDDRTNFQCTVIWVMVSR